MLRPLHTYWCIRFFTNIFSCFGPFFKKEIIYKSIEKAENFVNGMKHNIKGDENKPLLQSQYIFGFWLNPWKIGIDDGWNICVRPTFKTMVLITLYGGALMTNLEHVCHVGTVLRRLLYILSFGKKKENRLLYIFHAKIFIS